MSDLRHSRLSRRSFLAGLFSCGVAASCLTPLDVLAVPAVHRETRLFMGTIVSIDMVGVSSQQAQDVAAQAFAEGLRLESLFTRFDSSAPLGVLNAQGSLADVPPELAAVVDAAARIHALSKGAFDPTVLPVLQALERLDRGESVPEGELSRLYANVDFARVGRGSRLSLPAGMALTLDGIAKGHVAQKMSEALLRHGVANHLVNAGGDIVACGCPEPGRKWRVAVEDPARRGHYPAALWLGNGAVATSGVYEQPLLGGRASHLVIPASRSRNGTVSASVAAPSGYMADALATAFSVMSPRRAIDTAAKVPGVSVCLVQDDGRVFTSAGWPAA